MPKHMKFKLHIIFGVHRFLLSRDGTEILRILRYRSILENIDCGHIVDALTSKHVLWDSGQGYMKEDIRNETPHHDSFAIPYESERGDTLRYPRAPQPACRYGSFSFAGISEMTKRNHRRTCLPRTGKRIYHHAIEQRRKNQHFLWLDDATISGLSLLAAPTYGTENHTVGNEPRPTTRYRHHPASSTVGLFFEHCLNFRVGTGNHWPRLSQSKTELSEKSLALAHSQCNPKTLSDKG